MRVNNIKVSEAIYILVGIRNKNIKFVDIELREGNVLYFFPSKLPSDDEIKGGGIINKINFDENEEA